MQKLQESQKLMNSTFTQNFSSNLQKDKSSTQEVYTSHFEEDTQKTRSVRQPFDLKTPNAPADSTNQISQDDYEEDFN